MRVEVEIGSIEIDALPEGVSTERLRAEIVGALEAEILAGAVPTAPLSGSRADLVKRIPPGRAAGLGAEVAAAIYEGLAR